MLTSTKIMKAAVDVVYVITAAAFILLSADATGSKIEKKLASF